ncbi:unnamed protein product [Brassica napus]|uniref:(rape) hypothetical protein n=1 Tax=Brassica napus TaxID=3708 RepID=A0A816KWL3_BRANA|nr:unnamed protein product [Brassica napus]
MSLDVNMTSNVGLQGSLDSVVISWAYGFINYSTSTSTCVRSTSLIVYHSRTFISQYSIK